MAALGPPKRSNARSSPGPRHLCRPNKLFASQANSQDMNASGLLHVEAGRLRCLLWGAAAFSGGHVSGVPVPPVVLRGHLFVLAVMLRRLMEKVRQGFSVHRLGLLWATRLMPARLRDVRRRGRGYEA